MLPVGRVLAWDTTQLARDAGEAGLKPFPHLIFDRFLEEKSFAELQAAARTEPLSPSPTRSINTKGAPSRS